MTRIRLRPAYPPDQLAAVYPAAHDHRRWADHITRVQETIVAGLRLTGGQELARVADLSCGNGAVAAAFASPRTTLALGDYAPGAAALAAGAPGKREPVRTGMIEDTITGLDPVDLFICGETAEHLDDPDAVLAQIRERTRMLLLSTPVNEEGQGPNPEHYWSWDTDDVRAMLKAAGFSPDHLKVVHCRDGGTTYQIWGCT